MEPQIRIKQKGAGAGAGAGAAILNFAKAKPPGGNLIVSIL